MSDHPASALQPLSMRTPCKINLFLRVEGKRPDGYHTLDTVFFPLNPPCDELSLEKTDRDEPELFCDAPGLPADPRKNLCLLALLAYCRKAEIRPSFAIRLRKRIPVSAGLGGGSSDAACVLRLLQQKFQALSPGELLRLAATLGADVPFFLAPDRPARGRGIGEILEPLDNCPQTLPILLVPSAFPIPAAWAYQHWIPRPEEDGPRPDSGADALIRALRAHDIPALARTMRNDLEDAVFRKFPRLILLRERLLQSGALRVMLSGSGPTLMALYDSPQNFPVSAIGP